MALVSGGRSTLNPDAPLFVPAALRQVEDFSPEWWNLVTTSTWFHDYWLSQQEEDNFYAADEGDNMAGNDMAHLLPDTFDLGVDDVFSVMEAQFEEFLQFSGSEGNKSSHPASKGPPKNGLETEAEELIKCLSLSKSMKERAPKYLIEPAKYLEKPAKCVGPKLSPRCIQQPR